MDRNTLPLSSSQIPLTPEELNLKSLWTALEVAEKQQGRHGLKFGEACCKFRATFSAQGQTSANLAEVIGWGNRIEALGISLSSAKNWIKKWEEHCGEAPKPPSVPEILAPEPPKPPAEIKQTANEALSPENIDQRQLEYLIKRVTSLEKALRGLNIPRWKKHKEYAVLTHASDVLKGTINTL